MVAIPTAHRIASAACKLLEREGADAITMRRVAEAVGITPMAIYRHYPDRSALLSALADCGFADLVAALGAKRLPTKLQARLMAILNVYLDYALAHPRLFELMFLTPRPGARKFPRDFKAGHSPTANLTVALLKEAMDCGEIRRDDPWELMFEMGALIEGLIMLYLGGRFEGGAAKFRALVRRSIRRYFYGLGR